ncbi:MAG: hypothetical protein QW647_06550 [Candidatus Bathyarchaeia archaeon]
MNENLIQLAERIFEFACETALTHGVYTRYVYGWRKNANLLIHDIATIIQEALIDAKTHEFMNMKFWRAVAKPIIYVKFQGFRRVQKIIFSGEKALVV